MICDLKIASQFLIQISIW